MMRSLFKRKTVPRLSFAIIGAQKSGTTALSHFLQKHPDVFMPEREAHFFSDDNRDWAKPHYQEYERLFSRAKPHQRVGEKTPIYMFWPNALERLHAYNPDVSIIILLRDPVERAFSQWRMMCSRGFEDMSFSQAIREGRERLEYAGEAGVMARRRFSYVERGFYAEQIERVQSLFRPGQILCITHDQLRDAHEATLDRVCTHIGVDPFQEYPDREVVRPRITRKGQHGDDRDVATKIDAQDAAYLRELYADTIEQCESRIELDLSAWKKS